MVCDTSDLAHIKRYSNTIEATINKGSPSDRRTNAPHKQWFNTRTHTSDERWRSYNRTYVNAHIVSTTNSCVHGPAVKNVSNCELCVYTGMCCIGQSLSLSLSDAYYKMYDILPLMNSGHWHAIRNVTYTVYTQLHKYHTHCEIIQLWYIDWPYTYTCILYGGYWF